MPTQIDAQFQAHTRAIALRNEEIILRKDIERYGVGGAEARRESRAAKSDDDLGLLAIGLGTKLCTGPCKQEKPKTEFHVRTKGGKRTHQPMCKECRKEQAARRWEEKKDYLKEQKRAYRHALKGVASDRE
jgi:hypothetical protein